jgi:hypothetical protein
MSEEAGRGAIAEVQVPAARLAGELWRLASGGEDVPVPEEQPKPEPVDTIELVTRWGLVGLAALAALLALLRVFVPSTPGVSSLPDRLDQTTLLYLGVAGGLLLLRQVKAFSLGQLKLEMIEKLREQQQKQEERIADIALILPLLLADKEVHHLRNLYFKQTDKYVGGSPLREELRRLRTIGLIGNKHDRSIGSMRDGLTFDLGDYVELTDLGRHWAARIQELHAADPEQ